MSQQPNPPSSPRPAKRRAKKSSSPPHGSLGKGLSVEANRRAAVILEVLGGLRTPCQAAQVLKISVTHYYVLERKALRGLATECEVHPKGPRAPSPEQQVAALQRELAQCRREWMRQAALVRAIQRAVGLPRASSVEGNAQKTQAKAGRKRRRQKPTVRALLAVQTLRKNSSGVESAIEVEPSQTERVNDPQSRQTGKEERGDTEG